MKLAERILEKVNDSTLLKRKSINGGWLEIYKDVMKGGGRVFVIIASPKDENSYEMYRGEDGHKAMDKFDSITKFSK